MPKALLLANVGTPDAPEVAAVRKYLREFLSDPAIIQAPGPVRWMLVNLLLAPFRARPSARKYQQIWLPGGAPLLVHGRNFSVALQAELGADWVVALALRYGEPSFRNALAALVAGGQISDFVLAPLFPQAAPATSGSAAQHFFQTLEKLGWSGPARVLPSFPTAAGFIEPLAAIAALGARDFQPDHWLFSFHGLPEAQQNNPGCHYREECLATATALASQLNLAAGVWSVSFQSRLGPVKWLGPYTAQILHELPARGVRRLAVVAPSFVADCLETLEELAIRGRKTFLAAGGVDFRCVPCLNARPAWVKGFAGIVRAAAGLFPNMLRNPTRQPIALARPT